MSKQEEVLMNQNVAPEQFDWDSFESGLNAEDRKEKNELEEIYKGSLNDLSESDVIIGKVVRLTDKEAIVDINFKSEGVISLNEFRYNSGLKVGDEVEVMVDKREDKTGQLQLSHKKARTLKAWDKVNEYHQSGEIVNGYRSILTRFSDRCEAYQRLRPVRRKNDGVQSSENQPRVQKCGSFSQSSYRG